MCTLPLRCALSNACGTHQQLSLRSSLARCRVHPHHEAGLYCGQDVTSVHLHARRCAARLQRACQTVRGAPRQPPAASTNSKRGRGRSRPGGDILHVCLLNSSTRSVHPTTGDPFRSVSVSCPFRALHARQPDLSPDHRVRCFCLACAGDGRGRHALLAICLPPRLYRPPSKNSDREHRPQMAAGKAKRKAALVLCLQGRPLRHPQR